MLRARSAVRVELVSPDAMLDALGAPGPRPGLAERLMLFGQFVGSWDVEVENISADGQVTRLKAEWHFGWALEGRAVMDVWIAPPRSEPSQTGRYEYGASLRYYDESIDAWRSTWIGPVRHLVKPFIARAGRVGDHPGRQLRTGERDAMDVFRCRKELIQVAEHRVMGRGKDMDRRAADGRSPQHLSGL